MVYQSLGQAKAADYGSERDLLYKVLFDMKRDLNELKKNVDALMQGEAFPVRHTHAADVDILDLQDIPDAETDAPIGTDRDGEAEGEVYVLTQKEREMICISLQKHSNNRRAAARELGISVRTLYRRISEYNL